MFSLKTASIHVFLIPNENVPFLESNNRNRVVLTLERYIELNPLLFYLKIFAVEAWSPPNNLDIGLMTFKDWLVK